MNIENIIFILLLFIKFNICKYLIYPFKQNEYNNLTENSEIISYLLSLEYYTNISVAEPTQTIKSFIDFTKFHFYISNVTKNREYIIEQSESFNTKYEHDFILYTYSFLEGKYANETLLVNVKDLNTSNDDEIIKIKNFTFSMPSKYIIINRKMFPSSIGLGFYAYNSNHQLNFLMQLNLKNIINNTYFFIDFIDNINGNLYIGELPHMIDSNKYVYDNYGTIYTNIDNILDEWSFRCDFIYNYNEEKNISDIDNRDFIYKKNMKLVLDLNLNGIILDMTYFQIFNITFFDMYFKNKVCNIKKIEYLSYIFCDKDKVDITKFKKFYFYQKDLNYTFHLDYKDFFFVKNNVLFFNIFFDENGFSHLLNMGKIFFMKYLLAFSYDQKMIGFYMKNEDEQGLIIEDNKDNKNISSIVLKICVIVLMILIIGALVIIIIKCSNKKSGRKIRKNELDENYDYTIQNNDYE